MDTESSRKDRFAKIHYDARIKANRSQEYMALELDVAKKTVQNWEKGLSSPSFFQSLEWFRVLNTNPFPYYMSIIYPDTLAGVKASDSDEKINEAFDSLVKNIDINDKRALLYLFYGEHGSSPHSVIQLILARLHTPLASRIASAYLVANEYELNKQLGNIVCPNNILPDMDDLNRAMIKARESAIHNESSYNNVKES